MDENMKYLDECIINGKYIYLDIKNYDGKLNYIPIFMEEKELEYRNLLLHKSKNIIGV